MQKYSIIFQTSTRKGTKLETHKEIIEAKDAREAWFKLKKKYADRHTLKILWTEMYFK